MKRKHLTLLAFLILPVILAGLTACSDKSTPTATPTTQKQIDVPKPTSTTAPTVAPPTDTPAATEPKPSPTALQEPKTETTAIFEAAACPFELPSGQRQGRDIECGYLVVPEDRADPDSPTIRLAVAILRHPDGASEPDPIIYLSGGPGGSGLEFLYLSYDPRFTSVFPTGRDIIILDQRGVGLSKPALDCPAVDELGLEVMDYELDGQRLTVPEMADLLLQAILDCEDDLSAVADLSAYNTVANATDVNDLRLALGYEQVNLWGVSYGTRLALEVMRDYPEGLRSVVLDSVYPPDVDLYLDLPANASRAFDTLFEGCAGDAACNAAYPDLRAVFFETVDRLNENPAAIEITNPLTNQRYDALLTGDDLVGLLFQFLYMTDVLSSLPQIIYDTSQDNLELIILITGSLLVDREAMSLGMQLSVQCHEEFAFSSPDDLEAAAAKYPELAALVEDSMTGEMGFKVCEGWDSGQAAPAENQAITSDVPTLLMAGEYDPITPPAWALHAAETLPNSYLFEYPGVGHGASTVEGCPQDMMIAFLDDPTQPPDETCIAEMGMQFAIPGERQAVEMEPFTNAAMGIKGVAPAGWEQVGSGVYSRGSSGLDVAVLIAQAAPVSAEILLETLSGQLGLAETPAGIAERQANGLTWTLYNATVQGLQVDMALAESEGLAMIVLLQSTQSERDALYTSVFIPAIDALVPIE